MERILVSLDGSPLSESALPLAAALARDYEADLILFRAVRIAGIDALDPEFEVDVKGEAESYLIRIASQLEASSPKRVRWAVEEGVADRAIADAAAQHDADLVTMATHGRGGLTRLLLGSVAARVVQQAPVPVLLVRGEPAWLGGGIGDILVPLDGSELSEGVLPVVERLAGPRGFAVHLLHVVEPASPSVAAELAAQRDAVLAERRATAEDYLLKIGGPLEANGLRVRHAVRVGPVVEVIRAYVEEASTRLVAMTTHGRTGLERLLGSAAEQVLREVAVPVLLWRARPA
ncbi:MAG TPA: universal stress protein [Methylomirabilota bacterium]|jgi:nucleotide-binding universal stress UspA family protein|nr:universal stress protein [Methylomirabilota bacterium]